MLCCIIFRNYDNVNKIIYEAGDLCTSARDGRFSATIIRKKLFTIFFHEILQRARLRRSKLCLK